MAGLHFDITADNRTLLSTLEESRRAVDAAMKNIENSGMSIEDVFHRIERAAALSVAGFSLKGVIDQAIQTRSYFEDIESSMRVFLGSQEKAVEFTQKLQDAAYYNMFEFADLADASKQLIAYRNDVNDVIPIINKLSEVAVATKTPLAEMVSLYNRAKSTGTVDSNAIQSWATKGLVLRDVMKDLGIVTAGTSISFDQLNMALDHVTSEGGMFHGIQDAMMENISSNIGQLEDNLSLMFNDIGGHLQGVANVGIKAASDLVDHWQEALLAITAIASSIGIGKAVEIGGIAINKMSTAHGYDVELEQLRALLPVKEQEEQTTLQQAVASGRLSESKAKEIEETRQQVDAILEELEAKEKIAIADAKAALKASELADKNLDEANEFVNACHDKLKAVMESNDAVAIETAVEELNTAEELRNEAAKVAQAASEKAKATATTAATATTERETLVTQINTAQTAGNTAATNALAIAKQKLTVAMTKLNAVIEANKFMIITAALWALGTAIYKVCTYESDLEASQRKVNEAVDATNVQAEKEIKTLDELNSKLSVAAKGSDEWKSVKDAIVKQFGQYIPQLDEEITKVGSLATAYDDLKNAIHQANAAKGLKSFIDQNDNQKKVVEKFRESLATWKDSTGRMSDRGKAMLEPILREFAINSVADTDIFSFIQDKLKEKYGADKGIEEYKAYEYFLKKSDLRGFKEAHALNAMSEREIEQYVKDLGISKEDYNKIRYGIELDNKNIKERNGAIIDQEIKDKTAALSHYKKDSEEYKKIYNEIKALEEERKSWGSASDLKEKKGLTADQIAAKEENAYGKLADVMRRQSQERLRIEQDYEHERWQTRIDLMQEGEAKVLAQQKLDFEKERTALQRRKEQEIEEELNRQIALFDAQENVKAASDKKYAKKTFRDSDINQKEFDKIETRFFQLEADLSLTQSKAEKDRLDAAKESMNAYLKEFGNYQERRLAIAEEFDTKISEAQNEGERMMLIGQRNKALSDLDYNEWIETGEIALAFGEVENLSDTTVTKLISDMEKYREKVIATFDPDKIQKYEDALTALRKVEVDNSLGVLAGYIPDWFKQRKSVGFQMDSAGSNINALEENRVKLLEKIARLQDLIEVTGANGNDTSRLAEQLNEANVELAENENAVKKAKNVFKQLQEQWDSLNTPEAKFYALCDAVSSVSSVVGPLVSQASEMADAMGASGLASALGTLGDALDSVGNIASGFSQGGLIGGIAAGVGEVMKWTTKLFMAGDNRKQKNIERLQEQIDALNKSYEKLSRLADDAFSTDASQLIEQQDTLLRQQQALIRQQIAEEEAKKKTDSDKIKQWKDQLEEINQTLEENKEKAKEAIIGEDLKSAINEFASLYAEAWNDGTDAAQKSMAAVKSLISSALTELLKKNIQPAAAKFYDELAKAMEKGYLTDAELANLDAIKREMDALAAKSQEQWAMIQSRYKDLDELKEELTDISFDSVRDKFKSLLSDMESTTADFTNSFSDMLRNALLEGLMKDKYDIMLKEWYDEFAEAMDDKTLTDSERDALRRQYDAIVQQGLADRDFINDIVGGGAYSQEATKGGWGAMSQDTADELNGRFTALTELSAIGNTLSEEQNLLSAQILETLRSLAGLSMVTDGDNSTIREIRDMMFLSTGHLEDIAKYTKQLYDVNTNLSELRNLIDKRL